MGSALALVGSASITLLALDLAGILPQPWLAAALAASQMALTTIGIPALLYGILAAVVAGIGLRLLLDEFFFRDAVPSRLLRTVVAPETRVLVLFDYENQGLNEAKTRIFFRELDKKIQNLPAKLYDFYDATRGVNPVFREMAGTYRFAGGRRFAPNRFIHIETPHAYLGRPQVPEIADTSIKRIAYQAALQCAHHLHVILVSSDRGYDDLILSLLILGHEVTVMHKVGDDVARRAMSEQKPPPDMQKRRTEILAMIEKKVQSYHLTDYLEQSTIQISQRNFHLFYLPAE